MEKLGLRIPSRAVTPGVAFLVMGATVCRACDDCIYNRYMQVQRPLDSFFLAVLSLWVVVMLGWWLEAERPYPGHR